MTQFLGKITMMMGQQFNCRSIPLGLAGMLGCHFCLSLPAHQWPWPTFLDFTSDSLHQIQTLCSIFDWTLSIYFQVRHSKWNYDPVLLVLQASSTGLSSSMKQHYHHHPQVCPLLSPDSPMIIGKLNIEGIHPGLFSPTQSVSDPYIYTGLWLAVIDLLPGPKTIWGSDKN